LALFLVPYRSEGLTTPLAHVHLGQPSYESRKTRVHCETLAEKGADETHVVFVDEGTKWGERLFDSLGEVRFEVPGGGCDLVLWPPRGAGGPLMVATSELPLESCNEPGQDVLRGLGVGPSHWIR
jgi:hypothetical protein